MGAARWLHAARLAACDPDGPALLLPEIGALLHGIRPLWVPFAASAQLVDSHWIGRGDGVTFSGWVKPEHVCDPGIRVEAVYFGIPTIVGDRALFGAPGWTCNNARLIARAITRSAIEAGARLIVTGLGSGDITPADRVADLCGGEVVCHKKFDSFEDWIIARWL